MGQCYSVTLKCKVKDYDGAVSAMKKQMADDTHTRFNLDHFKEIGVDIDTFEGLVRCVFAGWENGLHATKVLDDGSFYLDSGFDACYGWEIVMSDMFRAMAPYLEDGSSLTVYPDSGHWTDVVQDGRVITN